MKPRLKERSRMTSRRKVELIRALQQLMYARESMCVVHINANVHAERCEILLDVVAARPYLCSLLLRAVHLRPRGVLRGDLEHLQLWQRLDRVAVERRIGRKIDSQHVRERLAH